MKQLALLSLFTLLSVTLKAQQAVTAEMLVDTLKSIPIKNDLNYEKITLPPIQLFLEAAKNYAAVQFYDARKREQELLLKISRKEWLKYFRMQGNYQYGNSNALSSQFSGEIDPNESRFVTQKQSWYNVGVVVSIPLDDIFTRKNKNDLSRTRIDQSGYELERAIEERQMIILEAYNDVVKNLALLKVNAESVALYDAQMRISERDFVNGRIDIISLSLERGRRTEANIKYQTSRAALHNSVTILEMLTKIKVIE